MNQATHIVTTTSTGATRPQDELSASTGSASVRREPFREGLVYFWAYATIASLTTVNPTADAAEGFKRYFPQGTTSQTVIEPEETSASHTTIEQQVSGTAARPGLLLPAGPLIHEVLEQLGLTKTQLKDACRVSRQTLYDWIRGKHEPDEANTERLAQLHEIAMLASEHPNGTLRSRLLTRVIFDGASFLDLLSAPVLSMPQLKQALDVLLKLNADIKQQTARATYQRLGLTPPSRQGEEENLEANLHDLSE